MNLSKRLNMLEKAIEGQGPPDEGIIDPPDWREQEARRVLPRLRFFALLTRYEDMPLPSDEEMIEREAARLQRFGSKAEFYSLEGDSDHMLEFYETETRSLPGFNYC